MMVWVGIRVFGRVQEGLEGPVDFQERSGGSGRVSEGLLASRRVKTSLIDLHWSGRVQDGLCGSGMAQEGLEGSGRVHKVWEGQRGS